MCFCFFCLKLFLTLIKFHLLTNLLLTFLRRQLLSFHIKFRNLYTTVPPTATTKKLLILVVLIMVLIIVLFLIIAPDIYMNKSKYMLLVACLIIPMNV